MNEPRILWRSEEISLRLGMLDLCEVWALRALACSLPEEPVVVNVGAGVGTSGLAFLESRPDLQLVTVDCHDESHPRGCLQSEREAFAEAGFADSGRYRQVHGSSEVVGGDWTGGPVDMVLIDGLHTYEQTRADILAWYPNIKPEGIIAMHDYDNDNRVTLAVDELYSMEARILLVRFLVAFRAWEIQ